MAIYPYTKGNLLKKPNTYFYTPYGGREFIKAWKKDRQKLLDQAGHITLPPRAKGVIPLESLIQRIDTGRIVSTQVILETLYGYISEKRKKHSVKALRPLDRVVKKFETTKRIYVSYGRRLRTLKRYPYKNMSLYVRVAEIFEAAYVKFGDLPYLNVLLKCNDVLCSVSHGLGRDLKKRVKWLILRELDHVNLLVKSQDTTI